MPELFVMRANPVVVVELSDAKLIVRVALFVRSTPLLALAPLLTVVAAKEMLAFEESILMPLPTGFVMLVAPVTLTRPPPVP